MNSPDESGERHAEPARAWKAVLGFMAVCLAIAGVHRVVDMNRTRPATRVLPGSAKVSATAFVGSQACAACHPGEYARHSRSGHSRTLRPAGATAAARRLAGKTFDDPERPGSAWTYELRDGAFSAERKESGTVERFVLEYAFGSGHHATTFAALTDRTPNRPTMYEHRLTDFAHRETPDITPGQGLARGPTRQGDGVTGRHYPSAATLKCFECHTVRTSNRGPQVLDEATLIPQVGCESCHGPGKGHVEAAAGGAEDARLTMPFGFDRGPAVDEIRMCGACHRLPETVEARLISPANPMLVRFQPVGLMQSACFRASRGELSCSTCHDPHARTSSDLAAYEAVCLNCHAGPSRTPCKVSPASGCVGCHMPRRDASRGMMMTDHWIRPRPEVEPVPR